MAVRPVSDCLLVTVCGAALYKHCPAQHPASVLTSHIALARYYRYHIDICRYYNRYKDIDI